jgi:hypothetical protein
VPLAAGHSTTVGRAAVCWEVLPLPGRAVTPARARMRVSWQGHSEAEHPHIGLLILRQALPYT